MPLPQAADDVRVMSYNLRMGTAPDGVNHWDRRRRFLVETITSFDPDLLGTQETLGFQRDFLAEGLPAYDHLGVGRDDGHEGGEMMALYFRRDRFERVDGGHFWLSETPTVPGSKGWDAAFPRMVTWVKLRDRRRPESRPIVFMNTHLDHEGATARVESLRLIRSRLAALAGESDLILAGDFNTGEGSPPYVALFGAEGDVPSPVVDSYRIARPQRTAAEGTFTGFSADQVAGERIDWIAVSPDWQVLVATIDRSARDGRTPSDHFAVTATLRRTKD